MLDRGDAAVLEAPVADFAAELDRMRLVHTRFQAVKLESDTNTYAGQAADAELGDLSAALKQQKTPPDSAARLFEGLAGIRQLLMLYSAQLNKWENSRTWVFDDQGSHPGPGELPAPKFPGVTIPEELPDEFKDYLEGALAWRNAAVTDKAPARMAWQRLLDLPPAQRHYKSTWAAYMLGRSNEKENSDQAIEYYQQVRALARKGFADTAGLAAASLGREARLRLQQGDFEQAIELYLEQLAAGDDSAYDSLRTTARAALDNPLWLPDLAANPRAQRVITAYLVSRGPMSNTDQVTTEWLEAVESAGVKDVDSAEKLALASYQNNQPALAQRWINRSPHTPVAQWLQVKLLLRAGKIDQAASLLAQVAESFPTGPADTNDVAQPSLVSDLSVGSGSQTSGSGCQVLGELGVLRLTRREYTEALDCLLKGGFWMDAAYVAERVLSMDELKAYVDRNWPAVSAQQLLAEQARYADNPRSPAKLRRDIRYLLARRLTRSLRGDESRPYYPEEFVESFDELARKLQLGWNEAMPSAARAGALRDAAFIARTNGMELLGTEVQPDWAVHGGSYSEGLTWQDRAANRLEAKIVPAGREEIIRASHHNADPEQRFHYRYQAAFLGWTAATLLPNNSDETARLLCVAGTWLKNLDAETADIFYKALVRRNRKTTLGAEADRRRWFPGIDSFGNMIQRQTEPQLELIDSPAEEATISDPKPYAEMTSDLDLHADAGSELASMNLEPAELSIQYEVVSGDTLTAIARHFTRDGLPMSVQQIIDANPGVVPEHIMAGQKLVIPFHSP